MCTLGCKQARQIKERKEMKAKTKTVALEIYVERGDDSQYLILLVLKLNHKRAAAKTAV